MIPDFLYKRLKEDYNEDVINKIIKGFFYKRPVTLRINTLKSTIDEILTIFKEENIEYESVSWYNAAYIIKNKDEEELKRMPIYKEGKIYLQSLSSMLPPIILAPKEEQILDMTAAPGGKTTEIAALTNNKAMITAIEKNKIRKERLEYNVEKQGANKVTILLQDARHLNPYFIFDKILLDAPCSGSGTLEKESLTEWEEDLIYRCVKTQQELLKEALRHVRIGGEILYSTCSILKEENELQIERLLKEGKIEVIPIDKIKDSIPLLPVTIKGTLCICPNELYEGFYIAKIKRIL